MDWEEKWIKESKIEYKKNPPSKNPLERIVEAKTKKRDVKK